MCDSNLKIACIFVLFYTFHCVTSVSQSDYSPTLKVKNTGEGSCEELLESFAIKSSNYTFCVILNSRPIKLCEYCVKVYLMVVSVHNDILTLEDEEGEQCQAKLLNLDKLQVINGGFDYVTGLWTRANCDACFVKDDQLNDKTKEIFRLSNITQTCIEQHRNDTRSSFGEPMVCSACQMWVLEHRAFVMRQVFANGESVTQTQRDFHLLFNVPPRKPIPKRNFEEDYQNLNNRYETLKGDGFCMDVVDLLNTTRNQWSSELKCCFDRKKPEWVFTVLSVVITCLPFVFYLAAFLFVSRKEHTVFRQRRLPEAFSSTATVSALFASDDS